MDPLYAKILVDYLADPGGSHRVVPTRERRAPSVRAAVRAAVRRASSRRTARPAVRLEPAGC